MNPNSNPATIDANSAACPLASLVLLAVTQRPKDAKELLEPMGLGQYELDTLTVENSSELATVKKIAMAGALTDRSTIASLMRVRVGVKLLETEDPRHLAVLVTAAAKLPPWVFGEEDPAVKPTQCNAQQNCKFPGNGYDEPDITAMSMQEAIAEAKSLITELEKPAKVEVR